MDQNYPNPFNPSTNIQYAVPTTAHVRLTILNLLGQEVEVLVDREQTPGQYSIAWTPKVASGVYFYEMRAANSTRSFTHVRRMVFVR
ncbi:MAG: T9SS type A sorting domain-containing protein [Ignavibacteriales bacterium]|nr:T9SS type A sorting domain-containing protein [Ignavibacteriales bacterium]